MKIKALRKELKKIQKEHGNLRVFREYYSEGTERDYAVVVSVDTVEGTLEVAIW